MVTTRANLNIIKPKTGSNTIRVLKRLIRNPAVSQADDLFPAEPLYVIGDIHGRLDLLDTLLARIFREAQRGARLVFVGDYVDRGTQSAEVLTALRSLMDNSKIKVTCLRGNHEAMMLDFLDNSLTGANWLRHGGRMTLESYGIDDPGHDPDPEALGQLGKRLRAAIHPSDMAFLRGLPLCFQSGNIFVSHAGADPERTLSTQSFDALIWGCPRFLTKPRRDNAWVVHGHYIQDHAGAECRRIGVDTGAFFTERLSAARIKTGALGFLVS